VLFGENAKLSRSMCDSEGVIFLDRSPRLFERILTALRQNCCIYYLTSHEKKAIQLELKYYGLENVIKLVKLSADGTVVVKDVHKDVKDLALKPKEVQTILEAKSLLTSSPLHPDTILVGPRFMDDYLKGYEVLACSIEDFLFSFSSINLFFTPIFILLWMEKIIPYRLIFLPFYLVILGWIMFVSSHTVLSLWVTGRIRKFTFGHAFLTFSFYGLVWLYMQNGPFHAYVFEKVFQSAAWITFVFAHCLPITLYVALRLVDDFMKLYLSVVFDLPIIGRNYWTVGTLSVLFMLFFVASPVIWACEILNFLDPTCFSMFSFIFRFERIAFWIHTPFVWYTHSFHYYFKGKNPIRCDRTSLFFPALIICRGIIELYGWQGFVRGFLFISLATAPFMLITILRFSDNSQGYE
jgi:hypothetical protein